MRVFYLANVGTRDVQRPGQRLDKPRLNGADLLANYDAVRSELTAPILSTGIAHVLRESGKIARVQLFVSDQPDPPITRIEYWERDTVEFGKLLQRVLREQFGNDLVEEIHCEPIRLNPADYNRMLPCMAERLSILLPPNQADVVYIAPVGGADASNVALTINAVRYYRDRCQFIYVMPDGLVHLLNLHHELLGDYARQEAAAHLQRHDYAALGQTLRRARLGKEWHLHLCAYANRRTRFDFFRAEAILQEAITVADSGGAKARLSHLQESLQPFLCEQQSPTSSSPAEAWDSWFTLQCLLLRELFFNLRLKAQQGEWVDFLGRLFRMREAVLRLVFEMETRHSTDKQKDTEFADFAEAVEKNPGLADYFREKKAEPRPEMLQLTLALEYWVEAGGKGKEYGTLKKVLTTVNKSELNELRNKSIVAHGYRGVSIEDVEKAATVSVDQMMESLRQALKKVGVSTDDLDDPYTTVQILLQAAI